MGLQRKIFIYAGLAFLVLMSLLTWISSQTINQASAMVKQERLALVKNTASDIDDLIGHLRAEVVDSASILGIDWQTRLTDVQKENLATVRNHIRQHLVSFHQIEVEVLVGVLDADSRVLWTEPYLAEKVGQSLADNRAIRKAYELGQAYIEVEETVLTQSAPTFSVLVPIKDAQGTLVGTLIADMPDFPRSVGFNYFFRRRAGGYNLELLTANGLVLSSSVPERAIEPSHHWEVIRGLAEKRLAGMGKHPEDGDSPAHELAYAPLTQVPWGVILERPEETALALPWMGDRPLLVSGLVLLLAAGLMWLVTKEIVSPLRQLSATAQKFGSGDLEAPITVKGHDEIGKLAESLDTMRAQLKHYLDEIGEWNRELEQRVKQRTAELEELDQQLREQNEERSALLEKVITTQEEERKRIARELHDEVGQSITSLMIGFKVLETQDPQKMRQGIAELKRLSAETLEEVRHLALELRPSSLDDLGLIPALKQYTREYSEKFGVNAEFQASGFEGKRLRPEVEIALYRIIQEALTNAAKHAEAKKVSVLMGIRNSSIVAIVEDDGKGFNARNVLGSKTMERKLGLYGMQERASLIGGRLTIESTPGSGTTIFVEVPWKGDETR